MESAFEAASVRVYLPEASSRAEASSSRSSIERDVAFFDEKLAYILEVHLPSDAISRIDREPQEAMRSFARRIQPTMVASFLPPVPPQSQSSAIPRDPYLPSLRPPVQGLSSSNGSTEPSTPNPFPMTRSGDEDYAEVEGVTVWEGEVGPLVGSSAGPHESKKGASEQTDGVSIQEVEGGYTASWEGEVPIAYVRTQIVNPLLALTASITLRPDGSSYRNHQSRSSVGTLSGQSELGLDGEEEYERVDDDEEAGMVDVDLLAGLGGSSVRSAARLTVSPQAKLQIHHSHPSQSQQFQSSGSNSVEQTFDAGAGATLRKSFRRVLSLSPGLRVRMRNLVLPQLLPPSDSTDDTEEAEGEDGEKKVVLCVEIENAPDEDAPSMPFIVSRVEVDIGGKGGKATAELTCQPSGSPVFPLRLQPIEQYNLLYGVSVAFTTEDAAWEDDSTARAVMRNLGTGEVNRPVSITVVGRPYYIDSEGEERYPTREFNSRWNCNLDLSAYYASLPSATAPQAPAVSVAGPSSSRSSRVPPPNAIVGDKRYSLATLLGGDKDDPSPLANSQPRQTMRPPSMPPAKRIVSGRPLMPSQLANQAQQRLSSIQSVVATDEKAGLMLSVRLLDEGERSTGQGYVTGKGKEKRTIQAMEEFSVEVYVNNRTEQIRRFRLSIPTPGREQDREVELRESVMGRRRAGTAGLGDHVLGAAGNRSSASSPGVIAIENDIRCGPLLPGASLSARLRFMALRDGVHRIEKLRVTGVGDEMDFIVSPVLDVVVGSGGG